MTTPPEIHKYFVCKRKFFCASSPFSVNNVASQRVTFVTNIPMSALKIMLHLYNVSLVIVSLSFNSHNAVFMWNAMKLGYCWHLYSICYSVFDSVCNGRVTLSHSGTFFYRVRNCCYALPLITSRNRRIVIFCKIPDLSTMLLKSDWISSGDPLICWVGFLTEASLVFIEA